MKIIYAFTVLATAMTASSEAHAYETSPQPLTRADCAMAGQAWNDGANVCNSNLEVSNSTPAEERVDGITQPLTRTACDKAGLAWNESANVCGSQGAPSRILNEQAAEMPNQPLTRAACSKAGIEWNERTNVCGKAKELQTMEGALPQTENTLVSRLLGPPARQPRCSGMRAQMFVVLALCRSPQQSAAAEMPAQPLTRANCVKAGLTWNESTNVCGNTERKASTVKAVPVAMPKPKAARAGHAKSTEATKKSAKKTYTKRRMTSRRQVQSAPTVPVERRPFRLFRKRPSATQ